MEVPVGITAFTAQDVPYPASTRRPGSGLRRPSAGTACQPEDPRLSAAPAGSAGLRARRSQEGRPWDNECISLLPVSEGVLGPLPGFPVSAPHSLSWSHLVDRWRVLVSLLREPLLGRAALPRLLLGHGGAELMSWRGKLWGCLEASEQNPSQGGAQGALLSALGLGLCS